MDTERNLELEIIDEVIDEKSIDNVGFVVDNDEKAEWAIRKLSEERAETKRYTNVCKSIIGEYEERIWAAEEKLKSKSAFFEVQLQRYFEAVNHKVTKTQEIYKLPSATLRLRYQHQEFKRDDALLTKWLKENGMKDYVKTEEKPNWAEIKKKVIVSGDKAVFEDGQIVDGVEVIQMPDIFEIEI